MEIEEMILTYGDYVYNYALKLSAHPTQAQDLTQETFIKAWEKSEQLREIGAAKAWLRKICLSLFLMNMRKKQNSIELLVENLTDLEQEGHFLSFPSPEEEVVVEESIKELQNGCFLAMVRRLTLNQRITFSLIDMFGLPLEEVASLLELSEGATKGLLHRARMNLDSFFHNHCNLINVSNPCSCKAWQKFALEKANLKDQTSQIPLVDYIDYRETGYKYDEKVRSRVYYLYKTMPEFKPSPSWYTQVINALNPIN